MDPATVCRICLGHDPESELGAPCRCRGTIEYVHRSCLERWLETTTNANKCEVCKQKLAIVFYYTGRIAIYQTLWTIFYIAKQSLFPVLGLAMIIVGLVSKHSLREIFDSTGPQVVLWRYGLFYWTPMSVIHLGKAWQRRDAIQSFSDWFDETNDERNIRLFIVLSLTRVACIYIVSDFILFSIEIVLLIVLELVSVATIVIVMAAASRNRGLLQRERTLTFHQA